MALRHFGPPAGALHQLRNEMDRLMTDVFRPWMEGTGSGRNQPAVNVWEDAESLKVEAELPGVKSEQLDISVIGNQLSLRVERPELEERGVTYHRRERPVGILVRVLRLPTEVNGDRVQAELRDGVLTITLPKAEAARPRKIKISGA
jgi:HSP20 family protein